jgi:chorismate mutase
MIPRPARTGTEPEELASSGWDAIRKELEELRSRISEEISAYPAPIAACDAHINHLLAERERVSEDLARLEETAKHSLSSKDLRTAIKEFVASSPYLRRR